MMLEKHELEILNEWVESDEVISSFDEYFSPEKAHHLISDYLSTLVMETAKEEFLDSGGIHGIQVSLVSYGILMCSLGYAIAKLGNPLEENKNG